MGTRNLTVVIKDNEIKVAQYCQWDGYPDGQGAEIVEFLQERYDAEEFAAQLDKYAKFLTQEQIHDLWKNCGANDSGFVSIEVSNKFKERYPSLHRDTGAEILDLIRIADDIVPLYNDAEFAKDGLFCEWTYVIDLDNEMLEVYGGYNGEEYPAGSLFATDILKANTCNGIWDINNIPSKEKFVAMLTEAGQPSADEAWAVLMHLRAKSGEMFDTDENVEMVEHICNYIEANMDDFIEAISDN